MNRLLKIIPPSLVRAAGRLQFRFPFLRNIINKVGQSLTGEGTILRGAGQGLYFNSTGCNPGFLVGTSEPLEQEILLRYAKEGKVVYDLGANAGYYVVIAAREVGHMGHVYAFEPTPDLVARIKENVTKNSFENVTVVDAAVTAEDGEVSFGIIGDLSISNSIRFAESRDSVRVRALRLDTFVQQNRPPDLMLVDIEGAELAALQGSLQLLAQHKPVVMVEVHWLGQEFLDFLAKSVLPLGYKATTYEGDPLPTGNVRYHALLLPE
ncbi:FkbM family methyltransferase [Armatimonas sp.]|uniref:FkbM family methyltransferase n=1 Tax=Armatimonas sp. TaxID=1872638 RepID=UPI00286D2D78|nr:FkbM family methyltransferase [Armatimonas sp.]